MNQQDYTITVSVDRTPAEVFDAINDVRGWWSQDVDGDTDVVGAEFRYRGRDDAGTRQHRATIRVTDLVPGEKVVWRVLENHMNFIEDQSEWKDTEIRFELVGAGGGTEIRFTHAGLVPAYECFDVCSDAWGFFIRDSLWRLITTGQGSPIARADAVRARGQANVG